MVYVLCRSIHMPYINFRKNNFLFYSSCIVMSKMKTPNKIIVIYCIYMMNIDVPVATFKVKFSEQNVVSKLVSCGPST